MPDPIALSSDAELRALVERALSSTYELDQEIGRGGMGIVYRARDRRLKRSVAIKLLPPELAFRSEIKSRFLREAETAAQLSHPNVVPIYTVDEREGLVYFVMALVDGPTLARRLHEEGRLGVEESRRVLREVGDALAYAHGRGVVHRDIKPDNILLEAGSGRAMVTDFGIARAVQDSGDSRLTATGVAIGTPAYMSPEQAAGDREIDGRSDLYSLGIVGYQMLVGELPFAATSTPVMLMKQLTERPVPIELRRPDVPMDLAAPVMTLLEKQPERRFPNAGAFLLALQGDPAGLAYVMPTAPAEQSGRGAAWEPAGSRSDLRSATGAYQPQGTQAQSGYGQGAYSQGAYGQAGLAAAGRSSGESITPEDLARWSAPEVRHFRRQMATYLAVNTVIILGSLTVLGSGWATITLIWSMVMARRYANLWNSNYDWRDVFRQPRDRQLMDVITETIDEIRGAFTRRRGQSGGTRESRRQLRESRRAEIQSAEARFAARPASPLPTAGPPLAGSGPEAAVAEFGRNAAAVQQALHYRGEIAQLIESLPRAERDLVRDVAPTTDALCRRIRTLAGGIADIERASAGESPAQVEREITELEAQANPLEHRASEERVRRLAFLKRQRRAMAENARRIEQASSKLESCLLALQNMRFDVLRLRAGTVSAATGQITVLTERARDLADEVDAAMAVADQSSRPSGGRPLDDSGRSREREG